MADEIYQTLNDRLRELPRGLDDYFERAMSRIDSFFMQKTALLVFLAIECARPFPLYTLTFLKKEIHEPQYALKVPIKATSPTEIFETNKKLRMQLQSCCGDLLTARSEHTVLCPFFKQTIDLPHRTVRDFLLKNKDKLGEQIPSGFKAKSAICRRILAMVKQYPVDSQTPLLTSGSSSNLINELLYYAYELEQEDLLDQFPTLDKMDRVMSKHAQTGLFPRSTSDSDTGNIYTLEHGNCTFLELTVQARLVLYIRDIGNRNPSRIYQKRPRPLLDHALKVRLSFRMSS